jgi:hypothetical protein
MTVVGTPEACLRFRGIRASIAATLMLQLGCSGQGGPKQIEPEYDKDTGKLTLLKYDSNKDGIVDTTSFMDGARVLWIEIDKDQDGKVERWEYYSADQKLEKVGFSRGNDGKEDAWSYADAAGAITRIEISTKRDGKVSRTEHYVKDAPERAEEDTDGDGSIDKWETFDSGRLVAVAFDSNHRGSPDRRLVYRADGSVLVEVDPDGDGRFTEATP